MPLFAFALAKFLKSKFAYANRLITNTRSPHAGKVVKGDEICSSCAVKGLRATSVTYLRGNFK